MPETDFDFDVLPQRQGTGAIKWDRYPGEIPYWVADMDFASPECILQALHQRVDHGVFGYAHPHDGLVDAVQSYLQSMHGVQATAEQLVHLPGMVLALSLACRAFAAPGDEVLICSPVYYPFFHVAADAQAKCVSVPHCHDGERWTFDWEALAAAVTQRTKMFILCNPQNPLGRVFSQQEIQQLGEFCEQHDLILVSDEIHCDLVLDPQQTHFSALKLPDRFRERLITLMAPSKTYNIAGFGYSFAVIENDDLRKRFVHARGCTVPEINLLAMVAAEAAYREGEPWRRDLIAYLRRNRDTITDFVQAEMPALQLHEPAATYLYWIDCSRLKLPHPARFFVEQAGIRLSDGAPFGGPQHVRFNFGCPHAHLLRGLHAMRDALRLAQSGATKTDA